ncbi:MAG TPA: metallopeptidase TldD-related protein, partial [Bacillota bacterium]|nr:metallopeptidase TldD-related protein [Bacillota bacterium]
AYTVILEPNAVFNLLMYTTLLGFSGKSLQQKSSFLTDRLGEKIFDEKLSIQDDWENENALGIPFDFEGTPRQKLNLIDKGVAREVAYDLASGAKAGVASTGHSVGMDMFGAVPINFVVTPGQQTLDEIIAETKQGLLVTRFHYMNPVNPRQALLTGLTRDGFYQIENGKVIAAVNNMRMTESMLKAFNQIEAISSDCERLSAFVGNVYVPAIKINQFHFTGKTGVKK